MVVLVVVVVAVVVVVVVMVVVLVVVVVAVVGYWWWRSGSGCSGDTLCKGGSYNSCWNALMVVVVQILWWDLV